jgi:L-2-amino-thiazoline-4-carboxylic acid hydrolase
MSDQPDWLKQKEAWLKNNSSEEQEVSPETFSKAWAFDKFAETYLKAFFATAPEAKLLKGDIWRTFETLKTSNLHMIVDEQSKHHLELTAFVLASYQVSKDSVSRDRLFDAVRAGFIEPYREVTHLGTRQALDHTPDPFALIVDISKSREAEYFGKGFTFERPQDDERAYLVDISRCFYHSFLVANGAAELAPVFCEFDANWIEAIQPDQDGFRFERPSTLAWGGNRCRFYFLRSASKPAKS